MRKSTMDAVFVFLTLVCFAAAAGYVILLDKV